MAAASAAQKGSKMERQLAALDESGAQKGKNSNACKSRERGQMLGQERKARNSTSARSVWKVMELGKTGRQKGTNSSAWKGVPPGP